MKDALGEMGIAIILMALALGGVILILVVIWPNRNRPPMSDDQYEGWRQQQSASNDKTESFLARIDAKLNQILAKIERMFRGQ